MGLPVGSPRKSMNPLSACICSIRQTSAEMMGNRRGLLKSYDRLLDLLVQERKLKVDVINCGLDIDSSYQNTLSSLSHFV